MIIDKPHSLLPEIILNNIRPGLLEPKNALVLRIPLRPLGQSLQTVVVGIQRVDKSNVRAHNVLAVLAEQRRQQTKAVECHVRGVERAEQREIGQAAEQTNLSENRNTLLDLVRPAIALALGVRLLEQVATSHMEHVVADGGAEALVLGTELVEEASVEGRAVAGVFGVGVCECLDF